MKEIIILVVTITSIIAILGTLIVSNVLITEADKELRDMQINVALPVIDDWHTPFLIDIKVVDSELD